MLFKMDGRMPYCSQSRIGRVPNYPYEKVLEMLKLLSTLIAEMIPTIPLRPLQDSILKP